MSRTSLSNETYSTSPAAVKSRDYRFANPEKYDAELATAKLRARRKQGQKVLAFRSLLFDRHTRTGSHGKTNAALKRVQFHLSKGRDVGDIAVRENWPVSRVNQLVAQLQQEGAK